MRTYKTEPKKVVDDIVCDCCGKSTTNIEQVGPDYATLESCWGYGSSYDGIKYDIQFCETCFSEIIETIKQKRKKILDPMTYPYSDDPLDGTTYF
jgi:hypothetical protein